VGGSRRQKFICRLENGGEYGKRIKAPGSGKKVVGVLIPLFKIQNRLDAGRQENVATPRQSLGGNVRKVQFVLSTMRVHRRVSGPRLDRIWAVEDKVDLCV